jgi:hypothetical protein
MANYIAFAEQLPILNGFFNGIRQIGRSPPPTTETVYTRAPFWHDIPDEKWMDWRWQMSNRLNSLPNWNRSSI